MIMEWLTFDNPHVLLAVQVAAIMTGGFVVSKILHLAAFVARKTVTSRTKTELDDRILGVIEKNIRRIVLVCTLFATSEWIEKTYQGAWGVYAAGVFFVLVVALVTMLLAQVIRVLLEWYVETIAARTESPMDDELVPLVQRVTNLLLYSIAAIICLDHFKIDIKALVVSLGVGSFALAFAAQETLANMIAGFVIMVDRPFRVGDRIKIAQNNQVGDVVKVGLRSTKILDFDNNIVTIPNSQIIKNEIINYSYPDVATRLKIDVGVAYGTDLDQVKTMLVQLCRAFPQIMPDPEPAAYVTQLGESAVQITLIGRVRHYKELYDVADALRKQIHDALPKAGIEIPLPQRVVHIRQNDR